MSRQEAEEALEDQVIGSRLVRYSSNARDGAGGYVISEKVEATEDNPTGFAHWDTSKI